LRPTDSIQSLLRIALGTLLAWGLASAHVSAQQTMQGDEALACEALLCLAAPAAPAECGRALARYFSISYRWFTDTVRGRISFLELCPVTTPEMGAYRNAVAWGAGRCDAASLNRELLIRTGGNSVEDGWSGYVHNVMPTYCAVYAGHGYSRVQLPRYLGTPEQGGYWVEATHYEAELAAFNARFSAQQTQQTDSPQDLR